MTTDLQTDRYDKVIRRVGGIIGPGSKVAEVITELFPMINVEDLPAELQLLGGTKLAFGGGIITGAALQSPRAMLFNPVDSGHLVTLTSVIVSSSSDTDTYRWGIRTVQLSQLDTQLLLDTRNLLPTQPVAEVEAISSVALANATGQTRVLINTPFTLQDPGGIAVLAPGTGWEIGMTTNVSTLLFTFYWRERPALESELNLP